MDCVDVYGLRAADVGAEQAMKAHEAHGLKP